MAVPFRAKIGAMSLDRWLAEVVRRNAADLLLVASGPPAIRVNDAVVPLEESTLQGADIERMVLAILPPHAARIYAAEGICDASYRDANGRFRINLHHERGRAAATIRLLPGDPPRLASLGFPPGVEALTRLRRGLVLIGGTTGSGETTTVAALVEEINRRDGRHIVTIEDPIEYEHPRRASVVEQIEIGVDAPDFASALRAAVRQAPDVIVLGEMRDGESMRMALAAAETGVLVFSTVHATDSAAAVARIADSFPDERQNTIRQELAMAASAILTQSLLPSRQGGRRVAAELLMVSYGARQHIPKNSLQNLHQEITISRPRGSFTLEDSLAQLVREGVIEREEAQTRATHPDMLKELLR
jgi:twitching motility protein PilT